MCQISVVGKLFPIVLLALNSELVLGNYTRKDQAHLLTLAHNFSSAR